MSLFNRLSTEVIPTNSLDSLDTNEVFNLVETVKQVGQEDVKYLISALGKEAIHFAGNILIAIIIYYVGRWLLRRLIAMIDIAFDRRDVEISVRSFARSMVKVIFYIVLALIIVQIMGVNTTSLVAMLASAGLAVGMALSGTLQNFAGGVMVLFLKPYRVGDYITAQGESGIVKEIMLFTTVLETYDRHTIFVPNSSISSSIIDNATFAETRRVDWSVGISYGDSVDLAREVAMEILKSDSRVVLTIPTRQPVVNMVGLGASSVDLMVRAWVKTDDYWSVYFDIYEQLYKVLPERGIHFPFPQMDLHIKTEESKS